MDGECAGGGRGAGPGGGESGGDARRSRMAILAKARLNELEAACADLDAWPAYRLVRPPETGAVMVRGRISGSGAPFSFGEITVTRCTIALDDATSGATVTGTAYIAGTSTRHAELAAVFDALFQLPGEQGHALAHRITAPLAAAQAKRRRDAARAVAATQVHFFTMARGD